ncbi:DUF3142 domain-containing protein [Acinetobacter tianfuensis]|uniref:DUF3142 domain-containing protein n=1 Tax=Acinetobacter tianfuensis TaxID=2419603 RepID=A0A3A8EKL6_9GAMM|nr:DUF3142 domain-containing protein [Acinetobacter tianfuensis]RKG34026.1 DUF3142 domain-containing protein [Acinetobacter tianfuensis]
MKAWLTAVCIILCCIFALTACKPNQSAQASEYINANSYDSFWIWGNIKSAPYLSQAKELYILQGNIHLDQNTKQSVLTVQGIAPMSMPHQKIWLVYRNHHLNWNNNEFNNILKRIKRWENMGSNIEGIQIDFDAQTKNLHDYALFLTQLRSQLPQKYKLSITGLMDWSNLQNTKTLQLFRNSIDEIAIQTYQGSTTIPHYRAYLSKISALNLPFKIGLVQHGQWDRNIDFKDNPYFKGYIVFLLREAPH